VPLVTIGLIAVSHAGNFTAGGGFAPFGPHGVFAALPLGVVFALQGFEQAVQMGGETRNPQRDMSRAVIGAVLIGTLIYLLVEVAFIGALHPANLAAGWANPSGAGDFGPYATIATTLGERARPYKLPAAQITAPLALIAANLIIYPDRHRHRDRARSRSCLHWGAAAAW